MSSASLGVPFGRIPHVGLPEVQLIEKIQSNNGFHGTSVLVAKDEKYSWFLTTATALGGVDKGSQKLGDRQFDEDYIHPQNGFNITLLRAKVAAGDDPPVLQCAPAHKFRFRAKLHSQEANGDKVKTYTRNGHATPSDELLEESTLPDLPALALSIDGQALQGDITGSPLYYSQTEHDSKSKVLIGIVETIKAGERAGIGIPVDALVHAIRANPGRTNLKAKSLKVWLPPLRVTVYYALAESELLRSHVLPNTGTGSDRRYTLGNLFQRFGANLPWDVQWCGNTSQLQDSDVVVCILDSHFKAPHCDKVKDLLENRENLTLGTLLLAVNLYDPPAVASNSLSEAKVFPTPPNGSIAHLDYRTKQIAIFSRLIWCIDDWWRKNSPHCVFDNESGEDSLLSALHSVPENFLAKSELDQLKERAKKQAESMIPVKVARERIRDLAQIRMKKLQVSKLPKNELLAVAEQVKKKNSELIRIRPDQEWVRWVLRAFGLHPLAAPPAKDIEDE